MGSRLPAPLQNVSHASGLAECSQSQHNSRLQPPQVNTAGKTLKREISQTGKTRRARWEVFGELTVPPQPSSPIPNGNLCPTALANLQRNRLCLPG